MGGDVDSNFTLGQVSQSQCCILPGAVVLEWASEPTEASRIGVRTLTQTAGKRSFLMNLAAILLTWGLQVCQQSQRGGEKNGKMGLGHMICDFGSRYTSTHTFPLL